MGILFDIFFAVFAWFTMAFVSKNVWDNHTDIDDDDVKFALTFGCFMLAPIMFAIAMAWIFGNGVYKWFGGKK